MAYAIARIAKLKGGSVAASGHHVDRTRETPNADREKTPENRLVLGEDRPLRELVTEMIDAHGGKPRRDSVECVELMLCASPEYFTEGREEGPVRERVRDFTEKAKEFLREEYGKRCVKAVLHLDEKTPHIQAFMVPIDDHGKLNCRAFFGSRRKLREFQHKFAAKMEPLGLQRGVEGSRATHMDIQRFYGAINREVRLRVREERLPDPPRVMVTEAARKEYKQQVARAVAEQFREPVNTLNRQAQLAREEKGKREAAEVRVVAAEAKAKEWAERFLTEQKENITFHHQARELKAALERERQEKGELSREVENLSKQVTALSSRVQDIPLQEVMQALGYRGEEKGKGTLYRDTEGRVAMTITDNRAMRSSQLVAQNSIDLTIRMHQEQGKEVTPREAITWLAETFGSERAVAATVVRAERQATAFIRQYERSRGMERQPEPRQEQARERAYEHERGGFSR